MSTSQGEEVKFLEKYGELLRSFAHNLHQQKPNYILAMTRKAPRLLELLDLWEIDYGRPRIITEKSLEFDGMISDAQKGIIIDDIIILGSTLKWLREDNPLLKNVPIYCVIRHGEWCIDEFVEPFHYEETLSQQEAAVFCTELVQSIGYLNKPYDVDHTVFYNSKLTAKDLEELCSSEYPDSTYEISTSFQRSIKKRRFTFLPHLSLKDKFIKSIKSFFKNSEKILPQISKCRLYYDEITNQANFVPMFIINTFVYDINHRELAFGDSFEKYNKLLTEIFSDKPNHKTSSHQYYRLFSYLTSYLYGIAFIVRNSNGRKILSSSLPADFLSIRDLTYLFGPSVSERVLERLNSLYPETAETIHDLFISGKDHTDIQTQVSSLRSQLE